MELKHFIKEALIEIVEAVREAQEEVQNSGARINPPQYNKPEGTQGGAPIFIIDVDVAVTATDSSGAKGGIDVLVAGFGVGSKADMNESNVSQNRIRFQVPVTYPVQKWR